MLPPLSFLWQSLPDETVGDRNGRNLFSSIPLIALKVQICLLCFPYSAELFFKAGLSLHGKCEWVAVNLSVVLYIFRFFRISPKYLSCVMHIHVYIAAAPYHAYECVCIYMQQQSLM